MASVARVAALFGLKRPLQIEKLASSRLPFNTPRGAFSRKPRSRVPQDKQCALLHGQHARSPRLSRCPLWPAFALGRALSQRWRRCLEPALVHALCWGFAWRQPRLARAFSWPRQRRRLEPVPRLAFCPGPQRLGFCGGGFLGHANELDASGALGGDRCGGICVQRRSPWLVCLNGRASDGLRARLPSRVDRPSAAKARSPCFMQDSFIWIGRLQDLKVGISGASYGGSAFARCGAARAGVR